MGEGRGGIIVSTTMSETLNGRLESCKIYSGMLRQGVKLRAREAESHSPFLYPPIVGGLELQYLNDNVCMLSFVNSIRLVEKLTAEVGICLTVVQ